jgi:hypothetical protein
VSHSKQGKRAMPSRLSIRKLGALLWTAAIAMSCGDKSKTTPSLRAATITDSCVSGDSLVFSTVAADSETKDLSGREIVLRRRGGAWTGSSRKAVGELGPFVSLENIKGDTVPGPISFSIPGGLDTLLYRGRIFCDSLAGEARGFRHNPFVPVTYPRISK